MFQNIKADVIYYKTNTDFEMEFNLCGCCRMRLLTNKAADRKGLVNNLSRAVSRSRIIMVVGDLFGEDNIIKITAAAIGKDIAVADNAAYGINSSEDISVIANSTPLVSADGFFGGCIIESGPQTMVLLTESKSIRKSVMNTLIHPYIQEVYASELTEKSAVSENASEEAVAEEEADGCDEIEAAAENPEEQETEDSKAVPQEEPENAEDTSDDDTAEDNVREADNNQAADDGILLEGGMVFDTEDSHYEAEGPDEDNADTDTDSTDNSEPSELYAVSERVRRRKSEYYNKAYGDFQVNDAGLIGAEYDGEPVYREHSTTKISVLIITVFILIALAVLCYCLFYVPSKDGVSASAYIKEIYDTLFG